jgi:transcriptional regulator with XRE-family HTH domain
MVRGLSATRVAGEQIRAFRRVRGWSLETLAGRVGLTRKGLSKIERGDVSSAVDRYERIARALGVPLADLFVGKPRKSERAARKAPARVVARSTLNDKHPSQAS